MQEPNERADVGRYRLRKAAVLAVGLSLLAVAAAVAYSLCTLRLQNVTRDIENSQRELQQSWVDTALEAIHSWNTHLTEQVRLVSGAEVFRLFAMDIRGLGRDGLQQLLAHDAAQNPDEAIASLAEQKDYMLDLLQDFVRSKGWIAASIHTQDGLPLLAYKSDAPVGEAEMALLRLAVQTKTIVYGSVQLRDGLQVMCVADPLFEVLGRGGNAPVAVLLATIPMEKSLTAFLSLRQEHAGMLPIILQKGVAGTEAIFLSDGTPVIRAVRLDTPDGSLPFKRRPSLMDEDMAAYSIGSHLSGLDWLVALEIPASSVDYEVQGQARQIYGLGFLGSLGAALLLACIWASLVSRAHKATAMRFQRLYALIRRQKMLLDSVNASLQAGLMLMDGRGQVQMCNPAFGQLACSTEEAVQGSDIDAVLPTDAAEKLRSGMEKVASAGTEHSLEISVPRDNAMHLYRVTLFPFDEERQDSQADTAVHGGCVGIFQDITEFRRRAEVSRRQKAMLDSVNASLQAGLMLMDSCGRVQMCNPAFGHLAGMAEEKILGMLIDAILPVKAAADLRTGMEQLQLGGSERSLEITIPKENDARLYRVTLFPYEEKQSEQAAHCGGCVGIFQDITEFRRRALAARQRQANSMAALVRAIESVDVNLVGHSHKMEKVAELLAASLDLPDKDRETLRYAARLSQVGKIFVPRELLTRNGKLTPEEQAEVSRAPEYAYNILRDMQFSLPVPEAVYQMGERMDGSGLPRHLRGEEIGTNARILAVVNAFCAMVSARSYRAGMPLEKAMAILKQDQGFDASIVAALAAIPIDKLQCAVTDTQGDA